MLKRITSNDPLQRLYISLHQSTLDQLQAYRDNYQQVYGDELPQNRAIEAILTDYMANDRDFQKFLKTWTPPQASSVATSGSPVSDSSEEDLGSGQRCF